MKELQDEIVTVVFSELLRAQKEHGETFNSMPEAFSVIWEEVEEAKEEIREEIIEEIQKPKVEEESDPLKILQQRLAELSLNKTEEPQKQEIPEDMEKETTAVFSISLEGRVTGMAPAARMMIEMNRSDASACLSKC